MGTLGSLYSDPPKAHGGDRERVAGLASGTHVELPSELARRLSGSALVLDTETTGLGGTARIWELAVLDCSTLNAPRSTLQWLLNPGLTAPDGVGQWAWDAAAYEMATVALGGEPMATLSAHPIFAAAADEILELLAGKAVCGWNADDFDRQVLHRECARIGFSQFSQRLQTICWHDLMLLYVAWRREVGRELTAAGGDKLSRYKLSRACQDEGIEAEKSHRATSGAACAVALLRRMAGWPAEPPHA